MASPANRRYMHRLLNFVRKEFGLLPRISPSNQICFRPQFCAIVNAGKGDRTSVRISLYGEHFETPNVKKGKFPNWRSYSINHPDDFAEAKLAIHEAYQHRVEADSKGTWDMSENSTTIVEMIDL